jgi:hypothetical protein
VELHLTLSDSMVKKTLCLSGTQQLLIINTIFTNQKFLFFVVLIIYLPTH